MATDQLVHLRRGEVAEIVLANPPLNLVTVELTQQLGAILTDLSADKDVRAVIVAGADNRAFCAGSDIGEFADHHGGIAERKLLREGHVYRQLATLPVPAIAAIEGACLGGGLELALCCDLRVAADGARLGLPETRLGVVPGSGGTQRLPRLVGPGRAKQLILTGELLDAAAAEHIGLVNRVVAKGRARADARTLAEGMAGDCGPIAVREAKRLIDIADDVPLDAGLAAELDASDRIFRTDDALEGAAAFLGKRQPRFRGR